ncbi:MAG TPA: glycosyltransferase family 2 protein [Ruania sp.]|nr:glycosyltransferase family 2 protein [Ruania sp.]
MSTCPEVLAGGEHAPPLEGLPKVSAIIATGRQPAMLRPTLSSIAGQDYSGEIEVLVVWEETQTADLSAIVMPENRGLRALRNRRTPGLAGRRNTGILAAAGALIAFCDDTDEWLPGKVTAQVEAWRRTPEAIGIATGLCIESSRGTAVRTGAEVVTFADLVTMREPESPSSSFLWRRADLLGRIGMVDEQIGPSYGADFDMLLRASRLGGLRRVRTPLVLVHREPLSSTDERWEASAAGLTYLLRKYPEFGRDRTGTAQICAQIAYAHAVLGSRPRARHWARYTIGRDRRQLRAYAALAVACRLLPRSLLVRWANRSFRTVPGPGLPSPGGHLTPGAV